MATTTPANPNSMITTLLRRIRFYLEEPEGGKYTNNDLLDLVIPPALQEVWGYINAAADNPVVATYPLTIVRNTSSYVLPPSVQQVLGVYELDSDGNIVGELRPRHREDYRGAGWYVEGNMLRFDPLPTRERDYSVFFSPVHDQPMHVGSGVLQSDLTTFRMSNNPSLGFLDKRENGYIGATVRLLGDNITEQRVIATYDPYDSAQLRPVATVRAAFRRFPAGTYTYEVFPLGSAAFLESVALGAALKLGAVRGLSKTRMEELRLQYRQSRKTEAQRLSNIMARRPKSVGRLTTDNPDLGLHNLFGWTMVAR